ncbi:MAG: hypothetical protein KY468_08785 [Armatimonadetes bacterium]|nr:hypothetical protein [Armatimonadota bacterium]
MRLLIVVYDQGVDETLMERLGAMGVTHWTKTFNAHGEGDSGRKLGDAIWPGMNNLLYLQLEDDRVAEVAAAIRDLQESYRLQPGITIWSLPVEAL